MAFAAHRIPSFDLLRAGAVLYIAGYYHATTYTVGWPGIPFDKPIVDCCLAILVFMSGFLLAAKYPQIERFRDAYTFLTKRFLRIYPLYLLALILFAACSYVTIGQLLSNAIFLNLVLGDSAITLWFIAIICAFYLFFPILMYRYSPWKAALLTFLICAWSRAPSSLWVHRTSVWRCTSRCSCLAWHVPRMIDSLRSYGYCP